ncbi:MAG: carboxypeptidase regulatory-like domain-containing protein, partial [bacterium]
MKNVTRILQMFAVVLLTTLAFATQSMAQTTLMTESFENGGAIPAGWGTDVVVAGNTVTFVTSTSWPSGYTAYNGTYLTMFNSFSANGGVMRLKKTTPVSTVGFNNVTVDFAWLESSGYAGVLDKVDVQWSTNGTTWNTAGTFNRYNAVQGWKIKSQALPAGAAGQATLYIAFMFTSAYGNDCYLDFAHVTASPAVTTTTVTIGSGVVSCNYPYTTYWGGGRTQLLYTAAQISAAGGLPGLISSIGFNVITNDAATMNAFNVRLCNTAATTIAAWQTAGMQVCYTGTYAVPGVGWQMINLTTPFSYDGTNLIVEVCYSNPGYTNYSYVNGTTAPTAQLYTYWMDGITGCSYTGAPYTGYTGLPNLRFVEQPIALGTLSGTVTSAATGLPIAGASVVVNALAPVLTNAAGAYSVPNLTPATVTVNVTATGFMPYAGTAVITSGAVTTKNIAMLLPPRVGGTVTDASTGAPITGAFVTVGTGASAVTTLTIAGGTYLTPLLSISGAQPIVIGKTGYDNYTGTITLAPGVTNTQDAALLPTAVQPGPFTAALNNPTTPTAVNLNWGVPQGMYQLIYDDGTQDNFAIWANANNLNALKFTPLGWPVKLIGGKVNLGDATNYPPTVLPFTAFKMMAYKADGAGGVPGTLIDSVTVTPLGFGWADFSFAAPITITSGDFYLVMKQGGIPPHAAGVGVDLTNTQLRSYSKFVTGGAPWIPAAGNFMIRAIMQGTGGPLLGDNSTPEKQLITAGAVNGLIYETPVATVTGYEGVARTEPFDWSTMQNTNSAPQFTLPVAAMQPAMDAGVGADFVGNIIPTDAPAAVLFDNGPLVNSTGTGTGGADESVIQAPLNSYGWNFNKALYYRMADDFTVSGNAWNVSSVEFYGYQTNSTTTSTFTAAYLRILNGVPGAPGTTVVWGDTTTNRMSSTSFTNIYRTSAVNGGVARPIMKIIVNTSGLSLPAGTYYVDFCAAGSLASGPWCPPVTLNNIPTTGNGLIYGGTAAGYQPLTGGATTQYAQGIPFKINGTQTSSSNMSYQVWRLLQGQEGTQASWTSIWTGNVNSTVDNSWPTLPNGPYRWAVKAIYSPPGQRPSLPTFSNVLGKGWIANVNVCVTLTCAANAKAGTVVKLTNTVYADTNYTKTTDTTGCVHFTGVWKGTYQLQVIRFTYPVYTQNVTIMGDATYNVMLLQDAAP